MEMLTRWSVVTGGAGLVGGATQFPKEQRQNFRRDVLVKRAQGPDQGCVIRRWVVGNAGA